MGVHPGMYLMGVHRIGMYPVGVHSIGVYLMGVDYWYVFQGGVHLMGRASYEQNCTEIAALAAP